MWLTRRPWDSYEWLMTNLGDSDSEIIPDGYVEPSPFLLHLYPVTIRLLRSKVASDVIFIRDDKQFMQYLHHAVIRWLSAASVSLNFLDCLSLTSPVVWYCRTSVRYWDCLLDSVAAFGPLSTTVSKQESLHDTKIRPQLAKKMECTGTPRHVKPKILTFH